MRKIKPQHFCLGLVLASVGTIGAGLATADTISVKRGPVDEATLQVASIEKDASIIVHSFSTDGANLGKPKHRDTGERAAQIAPHLLAVDVVEMLREHGFTAVSLDESTDGEGSAGLHLTGEFTVINPGSQSTRVWIGLGAGASKVCVTGRLRNANGDILGEFDDCEKGLGWGDSGPQTENEAKRIGGNIASLFSSWAEGSL